MKPILIAGLRANVRRWGSLSVIIALAVAFLTVSLGVGDLAVNYGVKQVRDATQGASVVIDNFASPQAADEAKKMAQKSGHKTFYAIPSYWTLTTKDKDLFVEASPVRPAEFGPQKVTSGRLPESDQEFVLDEAAAEKLGLSLGDSAVLQIPRPEGTTKITVTLVGLSPRVMAPVSSVLASPHLLDRESLVFSGQTKLLIHGGEVSDFQSLKDVRVSTPDQIIEEARRDESQRAAILPFLLFSVIALVVGAVVISTTMKVLAARRARELALLRLLGAKRSTMMRAMLLEGLILAGAASLVGLLLGIGILSLAAVIFPELEGVEFVPGAGALAGAWSLGVVATLIGTVPALRLAGGIRPLHAVTQDLSVRQRSTGRTILRVLALVVFVLSSAGVVAGGLGNQIGLAVLFGAVSAISLLPVFTWFAPLLASKITGLMSRSTAARVGAANIAASPARSGSTSAALLIGLTLVTMLLTAVSTSKSMAIASIEHDSPFDLQVSLIDNEAMMKAQDKRPANAPETWAPPTIHVPLTEAQLQRIRSINGIEGANVLTPVWQGPAQKTEYGEISGPVIYALPDDIASIARGDLPYLKPRQVFGESRDSGAAKVPAQLKGTKGTIDLEPGISTEHGGFQLTITADTARKLGNPPLKDQPKILVVKVSDHATLDDVESIRKQMASVVGIPTSFVSGGVMERLMMVSALDVLLKVALGLLGMSVIIAIIGVGDSLALSQLERVRDVSLLRALGMSRGQVGAIITWESIGLTLAALAVALPMGTFYGWMGAASAVPGETLAASGPTLDPVWLGLTILAGLILAIGASVVPARRAQSVTPAAGLVAE